MALFAKKNQAPRSTVPLKRVLRQGDLFICGVCRKAYREDAKAVQCLAGCLHKYLHGGGAQVVEVPAAGAAKRFRCHICKRVYENKAEAQSCAANCKSRTIKKLADERVEVSAKAPPPGAISPYQRSLGLGSGGSPGGGGASGGGGGGGSGLGGGFRGGGGGGGVMVGRSDGSSPIEADAEVTERTRKTPTVRRDAMHKFLRDGRKLICRKCGAVHHTLDAVIGCYDGHPATVKAEAEADQSHKYLREGAKYVCRNCGKKVFTLQEVVACYDGHPAKQAGAAAAAGTEAPAAEAPAGAAAGAEKAPALKKIAATDDADKFYRDGARYVCRTCNVKYFTRGEVIACFDKH
jgi:transposase-like protein